VVARGSQAGCFPCGDRRLYWFVTRNAAAGSHAGPLGNRGEAIECIRSWRVPFRRFVEATEEDAILRNDVVDRPARRVWGVGRVTLLGDAIHATTLISARVLAKRSRTRSSSPIRSVDAPRLRPRCESTRRGAITAPIS